MTDNFDPYYKWLAIPPSEQPPNHYRLLGVTLFEPDGDVIEMSAERQMTLLRNMQMGPQRAHSQKLLNEVARARACLLDPDRRAAYDEQLRSRQDSPGGGNAPARVDAGEKPLQEKPLPATPQVKEQPVAAVHKAAAAPVSNEPVPLEPVVDLPHLDSLPRDDPFYTGPTMAAAPVQASKGRPMAAAPATAWSPPAGGSSISPLLIAGGIVISLVGILLMAIIAVVVMRRGGSDRNLVDKAPVNGTGDSTSTSGSPTQQTGNSSSAFNNNSTSTANTNNTGGFGSASDGSFSASSSTAEASGWNFLPARGSTTTPLRSVAGSTENQLALSAELQPARMRNSRRITSIAISPDGTRVAASAYGQSTVMVYTLRSDMSVSTQYRSSTSGPSSQLCWSRDSEVLFAANGGRQPRWWNERGESAAVSSSSGNPRSAAMSPDGSRIAIASTGVTVYDRLAKEKIEDISGANFLRHLSYSPDGKILAGSTEGRELFFAGATADAEAWSRAVFDEKSRMMMALVWSADSRKLAWINSDGTIYVADRDSGATYLVNEDSGLSYFDLVFVADGEAIAAINKKNSVVCWEIASGRELLRITPARPGTGESPTALSAASNGSLLAVGTYDGQVRLWKIAKRFALPGDNAVTTVSPDSDTGTTPSTVNPPASVVNSPPRQPQWVQRGAMTSDYPPKLAVSHDGKVAVPQRVGFDEVITIADSITGGVVKTLKGHDTSVQAIAFSPDSKFLAAAGLTDVFMWNTTTGKALGASRNHDPIKWLAFSPDGAFTLVASDRQVQTVDVNTGALGHPVAFGIVDRLDEIALSADGKTIAASTRVDGEDSVCVCDLTTNKFITAVEGESPLALSADGRLLATGGALGVTNLYDVSTGRKIRTIPRPGNSFSSIKRLAFHPNEPILAIAPLFRDIYLINTETGELLEALTGHRGTIADVRFLPSGKGMVTIGDDRTVKLWAYLKENLGGTDVTGETDETNGTEGAVSQP